MSLIIYYLYNLLFIIYNLLFIIYKLYKLLDITDARTLFNFLWFTFYYVCFYTIVFTLAFNFLHIYQNMTAIHEISAAREPIGIAAKRQQYFDICEYRCYALFFT